LLSAAVQATPGVLPHQLIPPQKYTLFFIPPFLLLFLATYTQKQMHKQGEQSKAKNKQNKTTQ